MNDWQYLGQPYMEAPEQFQGFVYRIHDLMNDMYYIGKKNFWMTRKLQPLKGKTNRRHRRVESDWREYYGSNQRLNDMVAALGPDHFEREILILCTNKNQMNYFEMKLQFDYNVLQDARYYNEYIGGRVTGRGLTGA